VKAADLPLEGNENTRVATDVLLHRNPFKGGGRLKLRQIHRIVGLIFAPFFILTAVTGMVLLWRKGGVYGKETKDLLLGIHNWEIGAEYVGVILALGLFCMAVTGVTILIQTHRRRKTIRTG
jgi:succinate dehydrogenase/fumarate reductase cytochrome b subunit